MSCIISFLLCDSFILLLCLFIPLVGISSVSSSPSSIPRASLGSSPRLRGLRVYHLVQVDLAILMMDMKSGLKSISPTLAAAIDQLVSDCLFDPGVSELGTNLLTHLGSIVMIGMKNVSEENAMADVLQIWSLGSPDSCDDWHRWKHVSSFPRPTVRWKWTGSFFKFLKRQVFRLPRQKKLKQNAFSADLMCTRMNQLLYYISSTYYQQHLSVTWAILSWASTVKFHGQSDWLRK